MTFGKTPTSRITDLNTIESIVNLFASYGYKELGTSLLAVVPERTPEEPAK